MTLILVAIVSFIAAAVNSVAGGGTFLTFPTLTGAAMLSEKAANMTSTVGLWTGSAASIYAARKDFARVPLGLLVTFGVISVIGAVVGSRLLQFTSAPTFRLLIPWLLLFATTVFAFSKPIAKWAGARHGRRTPFWTIVVCLVQLIVAIYGGYFGAGIGILMLAGLSFAGLDDIHQMNAMKVLLATLINGVATAIFVVGSIGAAPENRIDWPITAVMVPVAVAGGFLGMRFARRIPPTALRLMILAAGVILTGVYFVRAYA